MTQVLTRETVAAYLRDRGLIPADAAPEVANVGRTHSVFRVAALSGALFVKQPVTTLASHYEACRREASLYALAAHDEVLRRLTPPLTHHDPRCGVLVTQERHGAVSFSTFAREEGDIPKLFEERLADALARHHSRALDPYVLSAAGFADDGLCPVVLTLGHARPDIWVRFGPIGPQVAALLRRRPPLARLFIDAQNVWRTDTLIHGDLGFENIILHPRDAASPWLYFVDWEMARHGDAAWDLATALRPGLIALMASQELAVEFGALRAAAPPSPRLAPGARFWRAYVRARGWERARATDELLRVVRLAGIQIAWSVVEASRRSPKFDAGAIHAVERALSVALEPGPAMRLFLTPAE
jgi:hypothetical protein